MEAKSARSTQSRNGSIRGVFAPSPILTVHWMDCTALGWLEPLSGVKGLKGLKGDEGPARIRSSDGFGRARWLADVGQPGGNV